MLGPSSAIDSGWPVTGLVLVLGAGAGAMVYIYIYTCGQRMWVEMGLGWDLEGGGMRCD